MLKQLLPRKMIAASIAACLFAIVFAFIEPDPFEAGIASFGDYLNHVWVVVPAYLLYALPILFTYGIIASLLSQFIVRKFIQHLLTAEVQQTAALLTLHLIFGAFLSFAGILGALLFFIIDFRLANKKISYTYRHSLKSLLWPLGLFIIFILSYWVIDVI